jgi:GTP pyrophosphokinase
MSSATEDFWAFLSRRLSSREFHVVRRASELAAEAHAGQTRRSGEPYIEHPLAVARIVAEHRPDAQAIAAALLHDVPERGGIPLAEIEARFGEVVARLVDGVTDPEKLDRRPVDPELDWPPVGGERSPGDPALSEATRKVLSAANRDERVALIKLASQLHNMRTLDAFPETRRRWVAWETEIYASVAGRYGFRDLKWKLEDLVARYLQTEGGAAET